MSAKLPFLPEQDGYQVVHGVEMVSVTLAGGAPRIRADIQGATARVTCSYLLTAVEYATFMDFYINQIFRGAIPFLADLVIDFMFPTQYRVTLVPDTFKISQVLGINYRVSWELDAEQVQFFQGSHFFISADQVGTPTPISYASFLQVGGAVQIVGAQLNDGVHPPIDLDGIYTIFSFPAGNKIRLTTPVGVNPDWGLLASYPGIPGTTPTFGPISIVGVPT